jgi:hypothetical protein
LTLLSATVTIEDDDNIDVSEEGGLNDGVKKMVIDEDYQGGGGTEVEKKTTKNGRKVTIHYDDMGSIIGGKFSEEEEEDSMLITLEEDGRRVVNVGSSGEKNNVMDVRGEDDDKMPSFVEAHEELEEDLSRPFALPIPARQALLSVILLLLAKKGALRSVSNAALFPEGEDQSNNDRWMLLLNWRALLSMLLRTAPYLDEHKAAAPPMEASSMKSKILKSTVTLIRSCRCFFDQGIRPPGWKGRGAVVELDATARALWKMTETELLYHTHSNSCFRAQIMLYLFHPSKCSSAYYLEVMPKWMESWRNVDRCPEYDFLWMVMFGRTRKYIHPRDHDWGALRRHLLTQCGYW